MKGKNFIHLDENLLIGKGLVRSVYKHPTDENKCVKVIFNSDRIRSVNREISYLKWYRFLKKPFAHLYGFHGRCQTTFGPGAIFELVRDYNGQISVNLESHIKGEADQPLLPNEVITLLNELYQHLLRYCIIICDPAPHNLLVKRISPEKSRLVIIDGIGNTQFIKIADVLPSSARRSIGKKWDKYVTKNPVMADVLKKEAKNCLF